MDLTQNKFLIDAVKRNIGPMNQSKIFISLYSDKMVKEPLPALQIGMAVLMDKPICVLAIKGSTVPENLKKIATAIEYLDDNSTEAMHKATEALMKKMGIMK